MRRSETISGSKDTANGPPQTEHGITKKYLGPLRVLKTVLMVKHSRLVENALGLQVS